MEKLAAFGEGKGILARAGSEAGEPGSISICTGV